MVPRPPKPQCLPDMESSGLARSEPRKSVSSLASSIDSELLRAVPMKLILAQCGMQWKRDADDYHLSQPVRKIDAFLSHDWGTSRWLKNATLLVHFNSVPAAVASLLMCMLVCGLVIFNFSNEWLFGALAIHGTYWFVFVFWQSIRSFYRRKMVFLTDSALHSIMRISRSKGSLVWVAFFQSLSG